MKYYLPLVGRVEACTFRAPVPTKRYEEITRQATDDAVHPSAEGGRRAWNMTPHLSHERGGTRSWRETTQYQVVEDTNTHHEFLGTGSISN